MRDVRPRVFGAENARVRRARRRAFLADHFILGLAREKVARVGPGELPTAFPLRDSSKASRRAYRLLLTLGDDAEKGTVPHHFDDTGHRLDFGCIERGEAHRGTCRTDDP